MENVLSGQRICLEKGMTLFHLSMSSSDSVPCLKRSWCIEEEEGSRKEWAMSHTEITFISNSIHALHSLTPRNTFLKNSMQYIEQVCLFWNPQWTAISNWKRAIILDKTFSISLLFTHPTLYPTQASIFVFSFFFFFLVEKQKPLTMLLHTKYNKGYLWGKWGISWF